MTNDAQSQELSSVAENYLLCLYTLDEEGLDSNFKNLSSRLRDLPEGERLGTSTSSVAGMLRRMAKEGLVDITSNKEVILTNTGSANAKDIVRRHRIAERMVVDLIGVPLHRAHIEAHRLEHAMSSEFLAAATQKLGNPSTCPFGGLIPGHELPRNYKSRISLNTGVENLQYVVCRVPEEDTVLLKYLVDNEILPDNTVSVVENAAYRGIIVIQNSVGASVPLGIDVATRIIVAPYTLEGET